MSAAPKSCTKCNAAIPVPELAADEAELCVNCADVIKSVTLTEDQFFERFEPIDASDGGLFWDDNTPERRATIEQAAKERRLFTVCDGEGNSTYAISGWHLVNRFAYIIASKPWEQNIEYICDFEQY